jgi:hypothetical protein
MRVPFSLSRVIIIITSFCFCLFSMCHVYCPCFCVWMLCCLFWPHACNTSFICNHFWHKAPFSIFLFPDCTKADPYV